MNKILVEIETITPDGRLVNTSKYVTDTIGQALDKHAPSPAQGAHFDVHIRQKHIEVLDSERGDRE